MADRKIGAKEAQLKQLAAMKLARAQATKPISTAELRESVAKVKPKSKKKKAR